jgi:hypothetical protein
VSDVSARYISGALARQISAFVDDENNQRYRENLNTVTPADVCFESEKAIVRERENIKNPTIRQHRPQHQKQAA